MRPKRIKTRINKADAPLNTRVFLRSAQKITGLYILPRKLTKRAEMLTLVLLLGRKKSDAITGTYVKHSSIAPIRAKQNTRAIGRNIFPSTLTNDKIGMKTMMMIN